MPGVADAAAVAVSLLLAATGDSLAGLLPCVTTAASWATGVSTVGDKVGAGVAGRSSGLEGVPAAIELVFKAKAGAWMPAAGDSGACDVVASMPAIVGAGKAAAAVSLPLAATVVPGMGLGSIAGLDSVCADMTAAASATGAGEPASAGLWIQPRS